MNFEFNEDQKIIQETVRDFAQTRLSKVAERMDREDYWPHDLFLELGELGLLGPTVPEEYGGAGADYIVQAIILEELAKVSPAFALSIGAHSNLVLDNIRRNANHEQKQKYLPRLCSGEWMGALCLTEPDHGSDALGMETTARREGDYYVLNGSKTFITNAPLAQLGIVYAKTRPDLGPKGISAFLVELDSEGVSRGKAMDKMGMRGSKTGELFFDEVKVPAENLMGIENEGRKIVMSGLSAERATLAAISVGICQRAGEIALNYSLEREQFGQKIANFQMIQDKLARMYVEGKASRLLVYWALKEIERDHRANVPAAASIYYAAERSTQIALDAIQVLGGYGYMKEYEIEKFARDAKLLEIGAGTSEIRKLIIAKELIRKGKFEL
ncbi:MAG: isovaleryl-CoA dehydrogenase [Methanobacteriota archaeon]|nr:MAG: isovaleryl-CoA dehydrogenase [Euryarchaeota archaeon]